MNRALCIAGLLNAAPVAADESTFPNKPGKKPEARIVIGVQSGATTAPPPDIVVGAGSGALGAYAEGGALSGQTADDAYASTIERADDLGVESFD